MERKFEINFAYVLLISLILHLFFLSYVTLPYYFDTKKIQTVKELVKNNILRDVIVNINQDNLEIVTKDTLLSDKSSSAKGYITPKNANNWMNNSLDFSMQKKLSFAAKSETAKKSETQDALATKSKSDFSIRFYDESEFIEQQEVEVAPKPKQEKKEQKTAKTDEQTTPGDSLWQKIPDKKGITLENAIFYSNSRQFSFNTKKFSNFEYFRNMKQKVASNWFPPIPANTLSTSYVPGQIRNRVIASQEVYLYFVMDRSGEVQEVVLVKSRGNSYLDDSCLDAVRNAKNFGPVPPEITGEKVVIPFIFGYYVR